MELRCSHDLALWLGAVEPESILQHRMLKNSGLHMMVRDESSRPMFWPWQAGVAGTVQRSS